MNIPADIEAGDVLLYTGRSVYDELIKLKTFSTRGVCHVEVAISNAQTIASRPDLGVNIYPLNVADLVMVRRPNIPFALDRVMQWVKPLIGMTYGYVDLGRFFLMQPAQDNGIVCSPLASWAMRVGRVPCFPAEFDDRYIAPRDFQLPTVLDTAWMLL